MICLLPTIRYIFNVRCWEILTCNFLVGSVYSPGVLVYIDSRKSSARDQCSMPLKFCDCPSLPICIIMESNREVIYQESVSPRLIITLWYHKSSNIQHFAKCIFCSVWGKTFVWFFSKGTFEISHKILKPYTTKYAFTVIWFCVSVTISFKCVVIPPSMTGPMWLYTDRLDNHAYDLPFLAMGHVAQQRLLRYNRHTLSWSKVS